VQDAQNNLVTLSGDRVQGYGVDSNFNIATGALTDIQIPLGSLKIAEATRNVQFAGNLKADGALATQGSLLTLGSSATAGFGLIPTATVPTTPPNLLETGSLLSEIADPQTPTSPLFAAGQMIELKGAQKAAARFRPSVSRSPRPPPCRTS
jgi:flagellar hook protein FlgE